jgi:hypothetical protein
LASQLEIHVNTSLFFRTLQSLPRRTIVNQETNLPIDFYFWHTVVDDVTTYALVTPAAAPLTKKGIAAMEIMEIIVVGEEAFLEDVAEEDLTHAVRLQFERHLNERYSRVFHEETVEIAPNTNLSCNIIAYYRVMVASKPGRVHLTTVWVLQAFPNLSVWFAVRCKDGTFEAILDGELHMRASALFAKRRPSMLSATQVAQAGDIS